MQLPDAIKSAKLAFCGISRSVIALFITLVSATNAPAIDFAQSANIHTYGQAFVNSANNYSLITGGLSEKGMVLFDFPDLTTPRQPAQEIDVLFSFTMYGGVNGPGGGFSFNYGNIQEGVIQAGAEQGIGGGLSVSFSAGSPPGNDGSVKVVWREQLLVQTNISFWIDRLPAGCMDHAQCRIQYSPTKGLTVQILLGDVDCVSQTITLLSGLNFDWNPEVGWRFAAAAAATARTSMYADIYGLSISAHTAPYSTNLPATITSFQDFSQTNDFDVGSLEVNPSFLNLRLQVSNPAVFAASDVQILTLNQTRRRLTLNPPRGHYGTNTVTVIVDDGTGLPPVSVGSYVHIIQKNIPPSISSLGLMTAPQQTSYAIPLTIASAHWPPSALKLALIETPTNLVYPHSLFIEPADTQTDSDSAAMNLVFTPALNTTGTGRITVEVTDPSGDSSRSTLSLTTTPKPPIPVVLGEGTALGLNPSTQGSVATVRQYAMDENTEDLLFSRALTFEAWVKPEKLDSQNYHTILSRGNGTIGAQTDYIFDLWPTNGTLQIGFFALGEWHYSTPRIPTNQWTHVAVTYDGTVERFYINGNLDTTITVSGNLFASDSPLFIGRQGTDCNCNFFLGALDEVRIWNVVRSSDQIHDSMTASLAPDAPGLLRYYRFDEGLLHFDGGSPYSPRDASVVGGQLQDSSQSGAVAVLFGYPSFVPGASIDAVVDCAQNTPNTFGLATQVQGTNAWGTAGVVREIFFGITGLNNAGSFTNLLGFPNHPDVVAAMGTGLEVPPGGPSLFGERIRGYLLPPQTGTYNLAIASARESQLWLSTDETPTGKRLIARSPATGIGFRQFDHDIAMQSTNITLTAGQRYYFEVLHNGGDDIINTPHLSVRWTLPSGIDETPIPASRIQPVGAPSGPDTSYVLVEPPAHGSLSISQGRATYRPVSNFFGLDNFAYLASLNGQTSALARVQLDVKNRDNRPVAGSGFGLNLDGVSAYLSTSANVDLNGSPFTIELWARQPRASLSNEQVLISHGDPAAANSLVVGWLADGRFQFSFNGSSLITPVSVVDTNDWQLWTLTYDPATGARQILRNGLQLASDTNRTAYQGNGLLYVGSRFGKSGFFQGDLDEIRVWRKVLSPLDVLNLRGIPLTGNEDGLYAYYRLDEGNGLIATDSSGAKAGNLRYHAAIQDNVSWIAGVPRFTSMLVPRNSPGVRIFLPAYDPQGQNVTYQISGLPAHGSLKADPLSPGVYVYKPFANYYGVDDLAYTVTAAGRVSSLTHLQLNVVFINIPPVISRFHDQELEEEDPPLVLPFTVLDIDTPSGTNLQFKASSSNPILLPVTNIIFGGAGTNRTVTLNPADGEIGVTKIDIEVTDGSDSDHASFVLEVKPQLAFAVVNLGALLGKPYSIATALNEAGQVVGYSAEDSTEAKAKAFFYTGFGKASTTLNIQSLGGGVGRPLALNDSGFVVGASTTTQNLTNAFGANPLTSTTTTNLGQLQASTLSVATAVNNSGLVVGYAQLADGTFRAFTGGALPLIELPLTNNYNNMWANAVNASGEVVGYARVSSTGATNAFLSVDATTIDLGLPAGAAQVLATAINDEGIVAGNAIYATGASSRVVIYDDEAGWTDLGDMLGGGKAEVRGLNRFGQIVGRALTTNNVWHAFLYSDGRAFDLNELLPGGNNWTITDAHAINDKTQITGVGLNAAGATQAVLLFPANEIGRRVFRPDQTIPDMPQIDILHASNGDDNAANSFFWSTFEQKLYAIRPVVASIKWHTGLFQLYTNETQFGDSIIRQVLTNEVLIPSVSFNIWPKKPVIHIANVPAQIEPKQPTFQHGFVNLIYSTADGAAVDPTTKIFNSPSEGYSVIHYLKTGGLQPNAGRQPNHFTVTRTVFWNDPQYLQTNVPWTVGMAVTNQFHNDYPGLNGYVYFEKADYDGFGADAAYTRTNRSGPILPVNANPNRDPLVVVWYRQDTIGTAWPDSPVQYDLRWPTNAEPIIIASGLGSGTLDHINYPNLRIYNQPNPNLAGFNPNEEHALFLDNTVFALRNDLNDRVDPKASEPFVLAKYQNPLTGAWQFKLFAVVTEQRPYFFHFPAAAGDELQAPLPISLLPLMTASNRAVSGPFWQDFHGKFYARAAGLIGGGDRVVIQYFYPLQPEFFYDLDRDGNNDAPIGTALPWLDQRPGGTLGTPVDVTYDVAWPPDVPVLHVGQTLTTAQSGLPDITDMANARVVYDSLNPDGTAPLAASARLFDPLTPRFVDLDKSFVFPPSIQRQNDPVTGLEIFPDLPFFLRVRLFHDPQNHLLGFRGYVYTPSDGGAPVTLVNVMSARERNQILALNQDLSATAFNDAVQELYVKTRNPNNLDLDKDGSPDDELLVGLISATITNNGQVITQIIPEPLGGGPKALTAGQPLPPFAGQPFGNALQLSGGASGSLDVSPVATTDLVSLNPTALTFEAWIRPEVVRDNTIISRGDGANNSTTEYIFSTTTSSSSMVLGFMASGAWHYSQKQIPVGTWSHVAVTYDGSVKRFYLNGVLDSAVAASGNLYSASDSHLFIGRQGLSCNCNHFAGALDEVRTWNLVRTGEQIAADLFRPVSRDESGLTGYWQFDEEAGDALDSSQNQLTGTLQGDTSRTNSTIPLPAGFQPPRYVVVAENNDPSLGALPISLHVIRVDPDLYNDAIELILPDNVLDERVTLRHTADFSGQPDRFVFEWYYKVDSANFDPAALPLTDSTGTITNLQQWIPYPGNPANGVGVNDITLGQGGESSLLTLSDSWFITRYGFESADGITNWSSWIGDPSSASLPKAMFVPGWIKRVLAGINLFAQRSSDFLSHSVNTLANTIAEIGPRYEGDVALNPDKLDQFGLIEIYETVLRRGRSLSINGSPPVDLDPANKALLLAAGRIADLYLLLANEAFADAADPTIGLGTDSPQLGSMASSIFAFENQVDSLLEEELALLRGRDDRSAGVDAPPVYNRLFWNFTGSDGEVAYVQTYDIQDENSDGFINGLDGKIRFPQGHGDAWGHYLTALTTYYNLLRSTNFTWIPRPEDTIVGGVPIQVNYQDERRFARAAAAKAQTGAEIVDRTYRLNFQDDAAAQLQGFEDTDPVRAWGVSEWARRAGMGAYFDWVVGNAILPPTDPDPTHTGIEKIDRTTVTELRQIIAEANSVQSELEQADAGLNPLGLARGVVPFDLDPDLLNTGFSRSTHFEQIYDRALQTLQNAVTTFNQASALSASLRKQQDSAEDFSVNVSNQELDYRNQLIEIFGYPYQGDLGPGTPYSADYVGPDLQHWMYIDTLDVTPQNDPRSPEFTGLSSAFTAVQHDWGADFSEDTLSALDNDNTNQIIEIEYPVSASDYGFVAPSSWGKRRGEGRLQTAMRDLVNAQAQIRQATTQYANQVKEIEEQVDLLAARFGLRADQVRLLNTKEGVVTTFNTLILTAKTVKIVSEGISDDIGEFAQALSRYIPNVVGLADDALAPIVASALLSGQFGKTIPEKIAEGAEIAEGALDFAKETAEVDIERQLETNEQDFEVKERAKELEGLVREEATLRLELFSTHQSALQAARTLESTLAEGQRLLEQRTVFRQQAAGSIQANRYRDLAFRIFRNDALQKYDAQFKLAARYVCLAARAYDYELNLGNDAGASSLLEQIVRERNLGELNGSQPTVGQFGLASIMGRMRQNFDVLKGQLGLNNDRSEHARLSLRTGLYRILPSGTNNASDANWRGVLQQSLVTNLWDVPEFRRHCRPFAPQSGVAQPGLVIRFSSTIGAGRSFFNKPLGGLDWSYDPSEFATRIRSVAVWFSGYDSIGLAAAPRVYLIPAGADILRSTDGDDFVTRQWNVIDQRIPVPFPITSSDVENPNWIPQFDSLDGSFTDIRKNSAFRAYVDAAFDTNEFNESTRLVGRSVWNTQWVLIIPGAYLLEDPTQGLNQFINSVSDIKLYFQTYSQSGN